MREIQERIRFNDYVKRLLDETELHDVEPENNDLTSPTSAQSKEETRLFMSYQDYGNMFNVAKYRETEGKSLKLRKFFKTRRHQQVEVRFNEKSGITPIEGKVGAIGREFVMMTNLRERFWIPYEVIETATIPYGIPNYSNTHQNFIYDNDLRNKLLSRFGETVSGRDILRQQFFEETLRTNLLSWEGIWVEVTFKNGDKKMGKIINEEENPVLNFFGEKVVCDSDKINLVRTVRWFSMIRGYLNKLF